MEETFAVRPARNDDAEAIAHIYNQGIEDRVATFETAPRSAAEIAATLAARGAAYPAVVVERTGSVVAWAWCSAYSDRPCYAGIAEFSVYVDRAARAMGAGRAALAGLTTACEERGFWKLLSKVFPENAASLALCRKAGFREVGTHRRHARLDGIWRDVVLVERLLGDASGELGSHASA
jgi:phosphinothricin acetyltransferase